MRAITDPEFSKWLLDIGKGRHVADVCNRKTQYSIEIPKLRVWIFRMTHSQYLNSQRAILCPKNKEINEKVLENLISQKFPTLQMI